MNQANLIEKLGLTEKASPEAPVIARRLRAVQLPRLVIAGNSKGSDLSRLTPSLRQLCQLQALTPGVRGLGGSLLNHQGRGWNV